MLSQKNISTRQVLWTFFQLRQKNFVEKLKKKHNSVYQLDEKFIYMDINFSHRFIRKGEHRQDIKQ